MTLHHIVKVTNLSLITVINIVNKSETLRQEHDCSQLINTSIRMQIIDCVIVSIERRQMIYLKMSQHLDLNMTENTIHQILNEYEYHHHLAIAKLFLTKNNMRNRLVFAQKYADYNTLN